MNLPEGQEWVFEMVNNILIEVLGTIAEQERENIRKRQAEGIEAAKQNGKKLIHFSFLLLVLFLVWEVLCSSLFVLVLYHRTF